MNAKAMNVFKVNEKAVIPSFATEGSACFDLQACFDEGQKIKTYIVWNKSVDVPAKVIRGKIAFQLTPGHRALIPTGLIFDIPEKHVLKIYNRSSTGLKKGLILPNGVGVVDSDYVNESFIIMQNVSESLVVIEDGERLAQGMLEPIQVVYDLEETKTQPEQKTSRTGGFGSTG